MAQQTINAGPPYTGAGDLLAVGWQKANANFSELYALSSKTLNAADPRFAASTIEATISNAINLPSIGGIATGAQRISIPATFIPYDATKVVGLGSWGGQMVREGGDWSVFDVWAYGAAGDGVTDDTASIRAAISAANSASNVIQFLKGNIVYLPAGSYLCTGTIQLPVATNQGNVTLRGATMRASVLAFAGATTNFTASATIPALLLVGSAAPDNAGSSTQLTQYEGIEDLTVAGTQLTGTGSVRGVQFTEALSCWMKNVIIRNLPNSSTGLYLRGSTVTGGLAGATSPETRECQFYNVVFDNTIGTGATSTPSAVVFQNADENDFWGCTFAVTPGLTGSGADSIFGMDFQCGRQNRFYGCLVSGDSTANKTQYVGAVFGPPRGENGTSQGSVTHNQFHGGWIEGFDRCSWNRADGTGNTTGNALYHVKYANYNSTFLDDNNQFRSGAGGFLSFIVTEPGLGPPDGPLNYYGGVRPPYSPPVAWASGNATPDVSGGQFFLTNNSSPTTITNFLNPKPGQFWSVCANDANTTIQNNANVILKGAANVTLSAGQVINFAYDGFFTFHRLEISRNF